MLCLIQHGRNLACTTRIHRTHIPGMENVMQLYPGADETAHYTLNNLKQLTTQTFNSGLATLGQFLDYYHDFQ